MSHKEHAGAITKNLIKVNSHLKITIITITSRSICLPDRASVIGPNGYVMTATAHTYFRNIQNHILHRSSNITIDISYRLDHYF